MADELNPRIPGGDAQGLRVEALGEPGRRRFRILAAIDGETYILWMEKQQVQALGLALEQLLEQLPDAPSLFGGDTPPGLLDEDTHNQFRVGRIELAFDERLERIIIAAHDIEQEEMDESPTLAVRISRDQARSLSAEAAVVVAAGRPRCPMCGSPMDPEGHVCPQQNGHLPLTLQDEDADWQ
ncbi:MAG: DUF3090 domain-containing protein [Actinomycetota bacterium]|nr:DUF3090 domain-containing protein [Actinomycetota bacterium]